MAERYDLKPRLATIDAHALDAFIETWADEDPASDLNVMQALMEEFDIDELSRKFQSAFV